MMVARGYPTEIVTATESRPRWPTQSSATHSYFGARRPGTRRDSVRSSFATKASHAYERVRRAAPTGRESAVRMGQLSQVWVVFVHNGERSSIHAMFADRKQAYEHADNLDPDGSERHLGAVVVKPWEVLQRAPRLKDLWRISHSGAQVVSEYPVVEELTVYEHLDPAWFRGDQRRPRREEKPRGVAVAGPDLDSCRAEFSRIAAEVGLEFEWAPQTRRPEVKRMPGRPPPV